jgi:nucleoside-diphosphate-sugar epimerase
MTHPAAAGERFIAAAGDLLSMLDVARVLRSHLGEPARKVPTRELPNWLVRIASRFDRKLKPLVPLLDSTRRASSAKAQRVLDWRPRPPEEAIVATARSLMAFGVVSGRTDDAMTSTPCQSDRAGT